MRHKHEASTDKICGGFKLLIYGHGGDIAKLNFHIVLFTMHMVLACSTTNNNNKI